MTVEIPETVEKALGDTPEAAQRRALECMVVEGYKTEKLSHGQVQSLLDLSWHEAEEFLARNKASLHYSIEDLEADIRTLSRTLKTSPAQ